MQVDLSLFKETEETAQRETQAKAGPETAEEATHPEHLEQKASEGPLEPLEGPPSTLTSDCWPPELGEDGFLTFKPPVCGHSSQRP